MESINCRDFGVNFEAGCSTSTQVKAGQAESSYLDPWTTGPNVKKARYLSKQDTTVVKSYFEKQQAFLIRSKQKKKRKQKMLFGL
jgi:hypothetical protein